MRFTKRKITGPLMAGMMMLPLMAVAAGCGTSQAAEPTVTIGYENAPDPESVAIEQKFFQKTMHAHVVLKYFSSGPEALTSLASGSLDFMTTLGNPPTASAIARGVPLKVIWAMERYTTAEGLVVRKGSHIHSVKDLEGKTVALVAGSTSPFELDTALEMRHLPTTSVQIDNMSPPDMVAAWKTGRIDAAYVWAPFLNEMQADNGRVLVYDQDEVSRAPIFNLAVVNSSFAAKNPKLVDEFVEAEEDGVKYFYKHPKTSYEDIAKLNGISTAEARSQAAGLSFTTLGQEITSRRLGTPSTVKSSLVTKSLTSAAAWLKQTAQIPSVPSNMSQYVDPKFCETVYHSQSHG